MKKLLFLLPLALVFSFNISEGRLTKKEKKFAVNYLTETKNALVNAVSGLTEQQFNYKPAPDRWSVKECLQHIAAAEAGLWKICESTLQATANPEKRAEIKVTDEQLMQGVTDRSKKAQAPEQIRPENSPYGTPQEALNAFTADRDKLIRYMKHTKGDLRNHVWDSPLAGMLDTYQVVLLIAAHSNRHTQQIEEVKANPGFPK